MRLVEEAVPSLALAIMFVVIIYQVVMRDVFAKPPTWSDELARYLYIYMVFLGSAHTSRKQAHIRMDVLPTRLAGRARAVLMLVLELAAIGFLVYALHSGIVFYDFYRRIPSPAMEMPSGYLVAIVPVACALMTLHHAALALRHLRELRAGS
ncbi:MAG: TRAP transporter small permease [Armatimonadota bacterium]|nr:TRAP transporter small permease [Armatimonadota bacterium]